MNALSQLSSGITGSQDSVTALAAADKATILAASDSHGNFEVLKFILQKFGPQCDAFFFCGDGFYDLVDIFEEACNDKALQAALPPVISFVQGNGDDTSFGRYFCPAETLITVARRRILCVHGHAQHVYGGTGFLTMHAAQQSADIVLYGHTHVADFSASDSAFLINPGSVYRPRAGQLPCFAEVTFTSEQHSVPQVQFYSLSRGISGDRKITPYTPEGRL